MTKEQQPEPRLVCGVPEEEVRKAYFKGKISKLLEDIQSQKDVTTEDLSLLDAFLTTLKKKDEAIQASFRKFLPIEDAPEDPIPDELLTESLTEEEKALLQKEEQNRDNAVSLANKIMKRVFDRIHDPAQSSPTPEELVDFAFELVALQYYIGSDEIYKERLFRKKITDYERTGKQRKAAEEYAKVSKEYREWRLAEKLEKRVDDFILLARKRFNVM